MGSTRGKTIRESARSFARGALCVFMSIAMTLGLNPARALADNTISNNTGSTDVYVTASMNIHFVSLSIKNTTVYASALDQAQIVLNFRSGTPADFTDPKNFTGYKAHWSYKKYDIRTPEKEIGSNSGVQILKSTSSEPSITLDLENILKDEANKTGRYKFTVEMEDASATRAAVDEEIEITVEDDVADKDMIYATVGSNGAEARMHGQFTAASSLEATDLGSSSKGSLNVGMEPVNSAAKGDSVLSAYQLSVVNATLINDDRLYKSIAYVTLPITAAEARAIVGTNKKFNTISLPISGSSSTTEHQLDTTSGVGTNADGTEYPFTRGATVTVPNDNSKPAYVKFPATAPGSYAIALPVPNDQKVEIAATGENGVVTGEGTFAKGSTVTLKMNPFEGYVLSDPAVTFTNNAGTTVSGISHTTNYDSLSFTVPSDYANTKLNVKVVFSKYDPSQPQEPGTYSVTISAKYKPKDAPEITATEAHGTVSATATVRSNNEDTTQTFGPATGDNLASFSAVEGTAVYLQMSPAQGKRVASVRIGNNEAGSAGITTYMLSAVEDNEDIVVVFEDGVSSDVQSTTFTVTGSVSGEGGGYSTSGTSGIQKRYSHDVSYGSYERVPVCAEADYTIKSVTLSSTGEEITVSDAVGKESYDVVIPYVIKDWNVTVEFAHKQTSIVLSVVGKGSISPAGTLTNEEYVYTADSGSHSFTLSPNSGHAVSKVWVDLDDGSGKKDITKYSPQQSPSAYMSGNTLNLKAGADKKVKVMAEFKPTAPVTQMQHFAGAFVDSTESYGTITPSGVTKVKTGQQQTFTFIPNKAAGNNYYELDKVLLYSGDQVTSSGEVAAGAQGTVITSQVTPVDATQPDASNGGSLTLTFDQDIAVVAFFGKKTLASGETAPKPNPQVKVNAGTLTNKGVVSPAGDQILIASGSDGAATASSITYTFTTLPGYVLNSVTRTATKADGTSSTETFTPAQLDSSNNTYCITIPADLVADYASDSGTSEITLSGKFAKSAFRYAVTTEVQPAGAGYVSPDEMTLPSGTSQTFYFVAKNGYSLEGVYDLNNKKLAGSVESLTFAVKSNTHLKAKFASGGSGPLTEGNTKTITSSVEGTGGSVYPFGETKVKTRGEVLYTFVPDSGYYLTDVIVDDGVSKASKKGNVVNNTLQIQGVNSNYTVTAKFARIMPGGSKYAQAAVQTSSLGEISPNSMVALGTSALNGNPDYGSSTTIVFKPNDTDSKTGQAIDASKVDLKNVTLTVQVTDSSTGEPVVDPKNNNKPITAEFSLQESEVERIKQNGWTLDTADIPALESYNNAIKEATEKAGYEVTTSSAGAVSKILAGENNASNPHKVIASPVTATISNISADFTGGGANDAAPTFPAPSSDDRIPVSVVAGEGGTVSPSEIDAVLGKKYTFVVEPEKGKHIDDVIGVFTLVDPSSSEEADNAQHTCVVRQPLKANQDGTYTLALTMPEGVYMPYSTWKIADVAVEASFISDAASSSSDSFDVKIINSEGGTVTPVAKTGETTTINVKKGASQSLNFVADSSHELDTVSITACGITNELEDVGSSYTLQNVNADTTIAVTWKSTESADDPAPGENDQPDNPTPSNPDDPTPGTPEPENPSDPDTPTDPDTPDTPDDPSTPGTPEDLATPDPENPSTPDPEDPADSSETPDTPSETVEVKINTTEGGTVAPSQVTVKRGNSYDFIIMPEDGYSVSGAYACNNGSEEKLNITTIESIALQNAGTKNIRSLMKLPRPYQYVTVRNVTKNMTIRVDFVEDHQAESVTYDQDSIRDASPSTTDGVAVSTSNDELVMKPGDTKDITFAPVGEDANGNPSRIDSIIINNNQYPANRYEESNGPGELNRNSDGTYTLTVGFDDIAPASEGGGIEIVASGSNKAVQHNISLSDSSADVAKLSQYSVDNTADEYHISDYIGVLAANAVPSASEDGFQVAAFAGEGGTVSISSEKTDSVAKFFTNGRTASIDIHPDAGYEIKNITINGAKKAWSSNKYEIAGKAGESYDIKVEFGTKAAAGANDTGTLIANTISSLSQTGDLAKMIILPLCSALCAVLGMMIIRQTRPRKKAQR